MASQSVLAGRDYSRFDEFLDNLVSDVYPEFPSEPHLTITRLMITQLHNEGLLVPGARVLDVGCGQGLALEIFRSLGMNAVGVTLGQTDLGVCRSKGFEVHGMDQNFLEFAAGSFDLLWCRHVLEHSVAPLFTLSEYRRLVKSGGLVYVEVPTPDSSAHHERNPNHYSVLPKSSWLHLMERSGFTVVHSIDLPFDVPCGPDLYWAFLLRRTA
ncbi:MAG TPA: class I SAM-dependent methyltransferase [Terracidiphilus sp.]|jgi:SAM-dependent methyltransferase